MAVGPCQVNIRLHASAPSVKPDMWRGDAWTEPNSLGRCAPITGAVVTNDQEPAVGASLL
jgi:hypothetical protein